MWNLTKQGQNTDKIDNDCVDVQLINEIIKRQEINIENYNIKKKNSTFFSTGFNKRSTIRISQQLNMDYNSVTRLSI